MFGTHHQCLVVSTGKALFQVAISLLPPVPSTVDSAISSADSAILCQPEPLRSSHDQVMTTASKDHPVRISKSRWEKWAYKIPRVVCLFLNSALISGQLRTYSTWLYHQYISIPQTHSLF